MKKVLLLLCCWLTALGLSAANPDKIYLIGNICGWHTYDSVEPDDAADGVYTWKNANMKDSGNGSSYFAFVGNKTSGTSDNWNGVGTRYGAESKDLVIKKNSAKSINNNENSWKVEAGYYKVVVDLNKKQVTLYDAEGDPDPDPVVDPTIDPNDCYVFFDNSVSNWSDVAVWAWGTENSTKKGSWPGDQMTKRKDGLWQWKLPEGKPVPSTIMFNDNVNDTGTKTSEFTFVNKATYTFNGSKGVDESLEYETGEIITPPVIERPDALYLHMYDNSGYVGSGQFKKSWNGTWDGNNITYTVKGSDLTAKYNLLLSTESEYKSGAMTDKLYGPESDAKLSDAGSKFTTFTDSSGSRHFWTIDEAADYTITVDWDAQTFSATKQDNGGDDPDPGVEYPATLYMIGNVNDWGTKTSVAADEAANGVYKWSNVTLKAADKDTYSYFTFVTVQSDDWNSNNGTAINDFDRYGATKKDEELTSSATIKKFTANVDASSANSWKVAAAIYDVVADLANMTITITKIGDIEVIDPDDPDPVIPDDPMDDVIVYVKGLDAAKIYIYNNSGEYKKWAEAEDMTKDAETGYLMYKLPEGYETCSVIFIYNGGQYPASQQPGKEVKGKSMILDWSSESWSEYTGNGGGDDPVTTGGEPTGTLPVLYINVYKYTLAEDGKTIVYTLDADGNKILNNEIIDKDLQHKNYFSGSEYWLETNGCEWLDASAKDLGSKDEPLPLEIKARGNFTRKGYAKKPFKLKLGKKQNLLGINRQGTGSKHWAILAHADDNYGYMRNFVGFRLGEMIGLPWTPNQQPIEVVINGNYRGIYFLTESIRVGEGRVPITELDDNATNPTDLTGGYLVELDNYMVDCTFHMADASNKNADYQYGALMVTADTPEEYSDQQKKFVEEQFTIMNGYINGSDDDKLWSYLDLDDAARYYVVEEILSHYEAYHGSTYLYRDRANEKTNGKWHFSPLWDCGHAFDGNPEQFFPDMRTYGDHTSYGNTWIGNKSGKGLRSKAKFMDKVKKTFQWFINKDVNNGKSPYEQLCDEIDAYAKQVATAAAADRERWKNEALPVQVGNDVPQPVVDNSKIYEKRDQVKSILEKKINWLKKDYNWGSAKLEEPDRDKTPAAELPEYVKPGYTPETHEIYVINDKEIPWTNVYLWLYNDTSDHLGGAETEWPGVQMTFEENLTVDGFKGVWHITVPEAYISARAIFAENATTETNRYPADGADGMELKKRDMVFRTSNNSWTEPQSVTYYTAWSKTLPLVKIVTPAPATDAIGLGDDGAVKKCSFELDGLGIEGVANIAADAAGNVTIKGRGRSTWTEGGKNSYKLKFKNKVSVLGMPASKHWVLMSYSNDAANGLLTNYVGHELSRLIGLNWTPSMKPVELIINDEYMGLYFIAENVRAAADRVQIADYGDTTPDDKKDYDIANDFLLEFSSTHLDTDPEIYLEWASENGFMNKLITATPSLEDIKDDKTVNEADVVATVMEHLNGHIDDIKNAVAAAKSNPMSDTWTEIIDAEQAAKYYIVQELMDDAQSFTDNFYMHHTTDSRWFFGPVWDFSGAFTQNGSKTQLFHDANDWGGTFIKDLYANKHFKWIVGATFYKFIYGEKMPETASQMLLSNGARKAASIHDDYDPAMEGTLSAVKTSIDDMVGQIQEAVISDAARWPYYAAHSAESSLDARAEAVKQKLQYNEEYLERPAAQDGAGWNLEDITTGIDDIIVNGDDADAPAEYFDLMGRRIASPQPGSIYIERRGATVNKMIAK